MSSLSAFLSGRMPPRHAMLAVWALASLLFLAKSDALFGLRSLDSDDAMRLIQVRDLLAGQGWYDLVQHRVTPPEGLTMHWSRIVDGGIALLIAGFGAIFPADAAELIAMAAWPALLLLPALAAVASIARTLGGARAVPLGMALFCVMGPAGTQFFPGRIDHHNVQIMACLVMTAAVLRLDRSAAAGALAGVAGALTLAVGIEALPSLVVLCGSAALLSVWRPAVYGRGVSAMGLALAGGGLCFAASAPLGQVAGTACDALSAPYLGAAVVGGLGLGAFGAIAGRVRVLPARVAIAAAIGAAALGAAALLGPNCLRGPVAGIDPRLGSVWLDGVEEMEPLLRSLARGDLLAANGVAHLAFGLLAAWLVWPLAGERRRAALAMVAVLQLAAFAVALGQIRGVFYADTFAAPLAAAGIVAAQRRLRIRAAQRTAAALGGALAAAGAGLVPASAAWIIAPPAQAAVGAGRAAGGALGCAEPRSYAGLQAVAPGLLLAPTDLGPFILAGSSSHAVLGAPYHRNVSGILASHRLLAQPATAAESALRAEGVAAVVLCGPSPEMRIPGSLAEALAAGVVPPWLEPVRSQAGVRIYRLRPE